MIISIFAVVLILLTMFKFISKRTNKKLDSFIGKIHCKCGWIVIILLLIHLIKGLSLFQSRPIYIYILGVLAMICILMIAGSYYFRKRLGSKWIIVHRILSCMVLILVVGHIGSYLYSVTSYQKEISRISISDVDLSQIPDGVYEGEYDVEYIYAKVKVTVSQGLVTKVDIIEHRNERGSAAEIITDRIEKEQKISVDAVTSATNSSKVIEKAVENALVGVKSGTN